MVGLGVHLCHPSFVSHVEILSLGPVFQIFAFKGSQSVRTIFGRSGYNVVGFCISVNAYKGVSCFDFARFQGAGKLLCHKAAMEE